MAVKNPYGATTTTPVKKPAPKPSSSGSGWGFLAPVGRFFGSVGRTAGRIVNDIGKVVVPLGHDIITVFAETGYNLLPGHKPWHPETKLFEPLAKEIERRGKAIPKDIGNLGKGGVTGTLQTISGSLAGLLLPGVTTFGQLTTKAGRKEIAEHPGFAIMDILPVAGKLKGVTKAGANAAGLAIAGTKAGTRAAAAVAPLKAQFSVSAAKKASVLHTIGREVHETVRASLENILPPLKKLKDADYEALQGMLQKGEKPRVDHPLRDLYDTIEGHQARRALEGMSRSLPEEYKQLLKVKSLNHKPSGGYQTFSEQLVDGVTGMRVRGRVVTEEGAESIVKMATQAFLDDGPNPLASYPELNKLWNKMHSHYQGLVRRSEHSYGKLYEEPITKGMYSSAEIAALRKKMSIPGKRGVNLTQIGKRAAEETQVVIDLKRYVDAGGPPNPNAFLNHMQREFARRYPDATPNEIGQWTSYYRKVVGEGLSDQTRAYVNAVKQMPPGQYQAFLDGFKRAQKRVLNQKLVVPGFGPAAARNAIDDLYDSMQANIMELVAKGQKPVWIPRKAVASEFETAGAAVSKRAQVPGSMKSSQGLGGDYIDDMGYMMVADEAAHALQNTQLKVISQLWADSGAHSYASVVSDLIDRGFSKAEADKLVRRRYDAFDIDTAGQPKIGPARDGTLLMPKEIAVHVKHMFNPPTHARLADKFLKWWMIPTLALAPAFHINNVIGGAIMTAMRVPLKNPVELIQAGRLAFSAARKGQILDVRIPTGRGTMPMLKDFMSPRDEAIAASLYGKGLKEAVETWYGGPAKAGRKVLDISERANQFLDQFYRNFTALARSPEFKATGRMSDEGVLAAQRLMQDYDSMVPFEREIIQRLIPFWTWKRTLVRFAMTYPVDHPVRITILNQMARQHEEQREISEWLDEFLMNSIDIGAQGEKGFRAYVSIRGMNPFSDFSNMDTIKGWIQSTHPLIQAGAKAFGYEPFLGGVPAFTKKEEHTIDPDTGAEVLGPSVARGVEGIIPQLRALQNLIGAPPPDADSMEGWYRWWKKYGAALRWLPSLMYINAQEQDERHKKIEAGEKPSSRSSASGVTNSYARP